MEEGMPKTSNTSWRPLGGFMGRGFGRVFGFGGSLMHKAACVRGRFGTCSLMHLLVRLLAFTGEVKC